MTDHAVDLSHHNTVTSWKRLRDDSTPFGWLKATEGETFHDPKFSSFVDGAQGAGIRVSGYHFAHAGKLDPQVKTFVDALKGKGLLKPGNLAPMLDMEATDLRATGNAFVRDFIPRFRSATGLRRIVVYANLDWFTNVLRPDEWADPDVILWLARYGFPAGVPGWFHPRLGLHQYTRMGRKDGVTGNVDLSATLPGWNVDHFTLTPAAAPVPTGSETELMERITVSPPTAGENVKRVLLSGSASAALVVRPPIGPDGFARPMWVGDIFAWGSDHAGIGHNPTQDPNYDPKLTSHRRYELPGALWADVNYSADPAAPFVIDSVG